MLDAYKLIQAGSSLSADGVQPELQRSMYHNATRAGDLWHKAPRVDLLGSGTIRSWRSCASFDRRDLAGRYLQRISNTGRIASPALF